MGIYRLFHHSWVSLLPALEAGAPEGLPDVQRVAGNRPLAPTFPRSPSGVSDNGRELHWLWSQLRERGGGNRHTIPHHLVPQRLWILRCFLENTSQGSLFHKLAWNTTKLGSVFVICATLLKYLLFWDGTAWMFVLVFLVNFDDSGYLKK